MSEKPLTEEQRLLAAPFMCAASRTEKCGLANGHDGPHRPRPDPEYEQAIAAAEERGRRTGIEVLELMLQHERVASHVALLTCAIESIRALAPRDSEQCEASLGASLPTHDQRRCGLPAGHEGDHDTGMHSWRQTPPEDRK